MELPIHLVHVIAPILRMLHSPDQKVSPLDERFPRDPFHGHIINRLRTVGAPAIRHILHLAINPVSLSAVATCHRFLSKTLTKIYLAIVFVKLRSRNDMFGPVEI